mmetsp:Transcript_22363/g.53448  ORF Transcript_22363/g.53448 Transcript_22363/m.53448 type:complete len:334 (+) Transcript_22363:340-1341(+)
MCGPFTRNLNHAPPAFLQHLQQQQLLQQQGGAVVLQQYQQPVVQACQQTCPPDSNCLPPVSTLPVFQVSEEPRDGQSLPLNGVVDDASVFNWNLLDETFGEPATQDTSAQQSWNLFGFPETAPGAWPDGKPPTAVSPVPATYNGVAPAPIGNTGQSAPMPLVSTQSFHVAHPVDDLKIQVKQEPAEKESSKKTAKPKASAKAVKDISKGPEDSAKSKPYAEKLPKELLDHPCAGTLLSAGIRIKGRTMEELVEVAERIKKRRRASAARCRARKATHVNQLEDENNELRMENMRLKQRIAELMGGVDGSVDLCSLLGNTSDDSMSVADPVQGIF